MSAATDFIVIGAGIAGASVASELAREHTVVLLEAEDAPGYHSTGRSAAMWVPEYGPPVIRALTKASGPFFHDPPQGFVEASILTPKGEMMLALNGQEDEIEKELEKSAEGSFMRVSPDEIAEHLPLIKKQEIVGGLLDKGAYEIDVDVLFQGFLRAYKARGGTLVCHARVSALSREDGHWQVETPVGSFQAPVVINASGAWGDVVAEIAGVNKVGLVPKRRSAALVPAPDGVDVSNWPLGFGAGETFYFKPSSGQLMISPADETPVEPHDAWADDMDIAEGIHHFQHVVDMEVNRVTHTWAGLRSFVADKAPVAGFIDEENSLFVLAGQGGYGIQTCPALSRLGAALLTGSDIPNDIVGQDLRIEDISPSRLFS